MNSIIGFIFLLSNFTWAYTHPAPALDPSFNNGFQEPTGTPVQGRQEAEPCDCSHDNVDMACDELCKKEEVEKEAEAKEAQQKQLGKYDDMEDARNNFGNLVEDYIAQESPDGYFPLQQKGSNKTLKLQFKEFQQGSLKRVSPGHFTGVVAMMNQETHRLTMVDFFVDFSTTHWFVERVSLAAPRKKDQSTAGTAPAH